MRALLLTLFLPTAAMAECINDTEVFSCQIGEKTLLVCHWKGALIYSFGPANAPDLTIAEPLETVAYTPWPGFSRSIWSAVRFENKGISYEVWSSFDRMDENAVQEGGVTVLEGDVTLASLTCNRGSVSRDLEVISELKSSIGQCWDFASQSWLPCP
jgi:hypothetical protein